MSGVYFVLGLAVSLCAVWVWNQQGYNETFRHVMTRIAAQTTPATAAVADADSAVQHRLNSPVGRVNSDISDDLKDLIRRLPKAELHIHIEGTLEVDMMMRLAARNNISLPYRNLEEAKAAR